jgi:hypothetical protein
MQCVIVWFQLYSSLRPLRFFRVWDSLKPTPSQYFVRPSTHETGAIS